MTIRKTKREQDQLDRAAIWKQAEEMNVPAFLTPLWKAKHGKRPDNR